MTVDSPLILSSLIPGFAGIGLLFLNWKAIKENNRTRQLQLVNDSFKGIKETELLFYKEYKGKKEEVKREWDSIHFNSVNWFAFLVNKEFINDKRLVNFFSGAIIKWYEDMFIKTHSQEEIKDTTLYPEFKKLYHVIKSRQLCRKAS